MRKFSLAAVLICALTLAVIPVVAHAQASPPPGAASAEAQIAKELNLTPTQVAKLKVMQQQTMHKFMALYQDQSLTQQQKAAKVQSFAISERAEVKAIMTPAQYAKLQVIQAQMVQRMRQNGAMGSQGPQ